jgi:hypothetical protein
MAFIIDDFIIGIIRGAILFISLVSQIVAGVIGLATRDVPSMVLTLFVLLIFLWFLWWAPEKLPESYYFVQIK